MKLGFAGLLALCPIAAAAQSFIHEISVDARTTATDNADLSATGRRRFDLITSVQPDLRLERHGPNLDLKVDASAQLVHYAHGTQPDGILPLLKSSLNATLVERLFFVQATGNVSQEESNAYGPRVSEGTTQNRRTASTYTLSPYVLWEASARTSMLLRQDESWTHSGVSDGDLTSHHSVARLDVKPAPVGYLVELSRLENDYQGSVANNLSIEAARAGGTLAIFDETILGAVVGRERAAFSSTTSQAGNIYGATLQWTPSPLTELKANVEHRFFGAGGQLSISHRTPFTVLSIQFSREPVTASSAQTAAANGTNLGSYLDTILSRSETDPVLRATKVQNQLTSLGLQSSVPGGVNLAPDYAQLLTGVNMLWVMSSPRNTATLSAYQQTARLLTVSGSAPTGLSASDTRQSGAAIELSRRLGPQTSVDVRAAWSKVVGLASRQGDQTRETSVRLGLTNAAGPRTVASAGVQYRTIKTTVGPEPSIDATALFVGLNHRF